MKCVLSYNAKDVWDFIGRVLLASVRPVFHKAVHISVELLLVFFSQVSQVVLQLVHRDQLAVWRDARVLVYAPHHTSSQTEWVREKSLSKSKSDVGQLVFPLLNPKPITQAQILKINQHLRLSSASIYWLID